MKKFLTVLLALSVVFTYSFATVGTAFATTASSASSDAIGLVKDARNIATGLLEEQKYGDDNGFVVTTDDWELALDKAVGDFEKEVLKGNGTDAKSVLNNALSGYDLANMGQFKPNFSSDESDAMVEAKLADFFAKAAMDENYAYVAMNASLDAIAANKLEEVGNIDTNVYSTTEYTVSTAPYGPYWHNVVYTNDFVWDDGSLVYVAKDLADNLITAVKDSIIANAKTVDGDGSNDVVDKYNNMMHFIDYALDEVDDSYVIDATKYNFLTLAEEAANGSSNEAIVAARKAEIEAEIARFVATSQYQNANKENKDLYDRVIEAYRTSKTYLAENDVHYNFERITSCLNEGFCNLVDGANVYIETAKDLKEATNRDGSLKYDASKIDENLKTILVNVYNGRAKGADLTDNARIIYMTNAYRAYAKAEIANLVDADAMTYGTTEYYGLEWKAVEAAVATYNEAVDAATVQKDIDDAKAALEKAIKKIDDKTKVLAKYRANGELNKTAAAEYAELSEYADWLNEKHGTTDPLVFDITDLHATMLTTGDEGTLVAFYIDNDARTADEIKALNGDVKALLEAAKTNSELVAEAEAVNNMIIALPKTKDITVADKDAIVAAYDAFEALPAKYQKYVTKYSTLLADITAVDNAEKKAIEKAIKALPALSTVTIADKEDINAVVAMIETYDNTEMYGRDYTPTTTIDRYVDKIRGLEFDAVKEAVKAIPALDKIVVGDKATIEAARAAYDALLAEYGDKLTVSDRDTLAGYEKTIVNAERVLAVAVQKEVEAQIAAVESMKVVKAHSAAGKGYIKVMWEAIGDETAIDGFQVYKSTKAQTGYTFMGKTTKHYMTNKKNLKKGKRYFYRVRAYADINGVRYFSDWSNKANRIAK